MTDERRASCQYVKYDGQYYCPKAPGWRRTNRRDLICQNSGATPNEINDCAIKTTGPTSHRKGPSSIESKNPSRLGTDGIWRKTENIVARKEGDGDN